MAQRSRFQTVQYHVLNDNFHHEPTFFYYITENWLQVGFYFSLLGKKTIGSILMMCGYSRVSVQVFHSPFLGLPSPSCLFSYSTAPYPLQLSVFHQIDLFIDPESLCIPMCTSLLLLPLPLELDSSLPFCRFAKHCTPSKLLLSFPSTYWNMLNCTAHLTASGGCHFPFT